MATYVYPALRVAPNSTDDAVQSYRESIRTLERHLDGEDTGLVVTTNIPGTDLRAIHNMTRENAREILIRELRRYAEFLEVQVCYRD
jgi:hypothetical protein